MNKTEEEHRAVQDALWATRAEFCSAKDYPGDRHTTTVCRWCDTRFWHDQSSHPNGCRQCTEALEQLSPAARYLLGEFMKRLSKSTE